jgi:asparagine synthase (glutamine-hydrolysing)
MANSLEVRVPFMDYRLVRLAERVPGALKQNAREFKILLKQAIGNRCPQEVVNRPKWGFDTPLSRWVKQPAIFEMLRGLPEGAAAEHGLVNPKGVRALVQDPQTVSRFARRAWNLFVLDVWLQVNERPCAPQETLSELLGVRI